MVSRIFHFLLIGLTLVSPAVCWVVGCGHDAPRACAGACCSSRIVDECQGSSLCCQADDPCGETSPSESRPCDPKDESFCQCFSAGAIVQKSATVVACPHAPVLRDVDLSAAPEQRDIVVTWCRFERQMPPGKGNLGRAMRCWHSSFLC